jgi:hypothetical protein
MRLFVMMTVAVSAIVGLAYTAQARQCYTTCNTYGSQTSCTQQCF